jgi:hypothetical protein
MTDEKPPQGEGAGPDQLAAAEALLRETAEALSLLLARVKAGEFGRLEDLVREQAQLRKAALAALHERQSFDKHKRDRGAEVPLPALDLAAARDEVGRRLARLRRAAGADGVSGEPE